MDGKVNHRMHKLQKKLIMLAPLYEITSKKLKVSTEIDNILERDSNHNQKKARLESTSSYESAASNETGEHQSRIMSNNNKNKKLKTKKGNTTQQKMYQMVNIMQRRG